jgi:hypothetical protein
MKWNLLMNPAKNPVDRPYCDGQNYHCLLFVLEPNSLRCFFEFLQKGFFVKVVTGKSIKQMLCDQFGVQPDYAVNRIKTIFYDGKPVDDMETAIVRDGSTLAFSAAMPGLVGATFRSGGELSPFRSTISYRPDTCHTSDSKEGVVFIKLFNLLVPEMGPAFLCKGILIEKKLLDSFLKNQSTDFWSRCSSVFFDNHPMEIEKLMHDGVPGTEKFVLLKLKIIPKKNNV